MPNVMPRPIVALMHWAGFHFEGQGEPCAEIAALARELDPHWIIEYCEEIQRAVDRRAAIDAYRCLQVFCEAQRIDIKHPQGPPLPEPPAPAGPPAPTAPEQRALQLE